MLDTLGILRGVVFITPGGHAMRCLFALIVCLAAVSASADTRVVVRGPAVVSAQEHATIIARRGTLVHSQCSQTEGIGMGSTPEQARRNCC